MSDDDPDMPSERVLREFARMSLEHAMQTIAAQARKMADEIPPDATGREALLAFARAILATSQRTLGDRDRPN
jgi:hypothetical protein